MGYSILGAIGSNILNLIFLAIFNIFVHTIFTLATGVQPGHGLPNPITDPAAFSLGMYTFLAAMMLSGIASGLLSHHFLRTPPAWAGFQSCSALPMVILMNHLRMRPLAPGEPSHGFYIACCIMTVLLGSVSAVLRAPPSSRSSSLYPK
jgi:hypothetical protein